MGRLPRVYKWGAAGIALGAGLALATTGLGVERAIQGLSPVVQAVFACRKLQASDARLGCYDEAVAKMEQAVAGGDLVSVDREQRREVRRQAFGLSLPTLAIFDRGESQEELDHLALKVVQASRGGDGRWVVVLEGGQVWRQTDSMSLSRPPAPGAVATIRRGVLGSYSMSIDGHPGFQAHRAN